MIGSATTIASSGTNIQASRPRQVVVEFDRRDFDLCSVTKGADGMVRMDGSLSSRQTGIRPDGSAVA